jgi:hypothetical protein
MPTRGLTGPDSALPAAGPARRIGLVGCVKEKASGPRAAKDLYVSTLFAGRRGFVQRTCGEWWILSAEHGLVHPDEVIAPYDVTLKDAGRAERREWSARVLRAIDERVRPAADDIFEIHAGAEYRDFGLVVGRRIRGCVVENPTEGLGIGQQLQFYKQAGESGPSRRRVEIDRFYTLLAELEQRCGGKRRLAECRGRMSWPERGVYFFFEDGELREDGVSPRVVRVGTHGLVPSKSTLWGRLSQHKGSTGGSMSGGGNHRGSIFRLHVGTALLASGAWPESIRSSWLVGSSAKSDVLRAEYPLERGVSKHIGAMPFLWLGVDDPAGPESDRGVIEAGAIALLSNLDRAPIDAPSAGWLGRRADSRLVRESGLWNVNHVQDLPGGSFLDVFAHGVRV